MAYCTGCGRELKPGVRFCTACGKPVPNVNTDAPASVPGPSPQQPKKKKSKALPILLISLVVLLLAGAAIWWFLLRDTDTDNEDERDEKTEQTAAEKIPADAVSFEQMVEDEQEYAVITGKADKGDELWTVKTGSYGVSQLDRVQGLAIIGDHYCYIEDGDVVALDLTDGSEVWRNTEFSGALGGYTYDEDGTIYLCGYFGPDLFVVNKDGETVFRIPELKEGYIWPYDIRFTDEGNLLLTFEQVGEGGGEGTITIDRSDYSILAVTGEAEAPAEPETPRNISVAASSTLQEAGHDHSPYLVLDGSAATAWVEGASGNGEGEWLRLDLGMDCHVSGMQLWSGYQKSESLFHKNSRPARIRITFSDGSSMEADLTDTMGMQSISFGGDVVTSTITITIVSVYPGSAYTDTCISDITLS